MAARIAEALRSSRSRLHRWAFAASSGRVGSRWGGLPVVMLTTIGRRTGRRRITMLATPLQEGGRIVLVASNGGAPRHPDWFLNLRERPDVEVVMRDRRGPMRARTATPDEEDRLWPIVTRTSPSYGRYRARTRRAIPLVVLEPAPSR